MIKTSIIAGAACLALSGAASAAVIDFDTSNGTLLGNGALVTTISSVDGTVTADVTATRLNSKGKEKNGRARTYDTLGNGADPDLEPTYFGKDLNVLNPQPVLNNVLIVDTRTTGASTISNPNDNRFGGFLTFDFGPSAAVFSGVTFIDDGLLKIEGFLKGVSVGTATIDNGSGSKFDSVVQELKLASGWTVDELVFDFGRQSGAIDNVMVSAVPLPAGAALLLTGLAGLGFARRRGARA